MKQLVLGLTLCLTAGLFAADRPKERYANDFEKATLDKVPDDFLVLDGAFAVMEEGGNKFLELPGAPLETFGVLFGPTEGAGSSVSARIFGTAKGRRFPSFAVGLHGVGGYKLQVSPAKKLIELYKGDEMVASKPFDWKSDAWSVLRLQTRKTKNDEIKIEGKVWPHGAEEPAEWLISYIDKTELPPGRASVWGNPFSGTPIRYDDLLVTAAGAD